MSKPRKRRLTYRAFLSVGIASGVAGLALGALSGGGIWNTLSAVLYTAALILLLVAAVYYER